MDQFLLSIYWANLTPRHTPIPYDNSITFTGDSPEFIDEYGAGNKGGYGDGDGTGDAFGEDSGTGRGSGSGDGDGHYKGLGDGYGSGDDYGYSNGCADVDG